MAARKARMTPTPKTPPLTKQDDTQPPRAALRVGDLVLYTVATGPNSGAQRAATLAEPVSSDGAACLRVHWSPRDTPHEPDSKLIDVPHATRSTPGTWTERT